MLALVVLMTLVELAESIRTFSTLETCKLRLMPMSPIRHSMLNPFAIFRVVVIVIKNNKFLETKRIFAHKVL